MRSISRLLVLWLLVQGMCSCEYNLDETNFRDVQKPGGTRSFDLQLVSEFDTIAVFNPTVFTYSFNLYGVAIRQAVFSLQGKTWTVDLESDKFSLSPGDFVPGIDTLKVVLYGKTGSGSLADVTGAENYVTVKKWVVSIDGRPAPQLLVTKAITNDGYLKLSWPGCNQFNFSYYQLYGLINGNSSVKVIHYADSISYVDSCYIGGPASYSLGVRVFTDYEIAWGGAVDMETPYPRMKFEDISADSTRVSWDKSKFKATYQLSKTSPYPDSLLLYSHNDTSIIISSPGFGSYAEYELLTMPFRPESANPVYTRKDDNRYFLGQSIANNWPDYSYNRLEKVVYTNFDQKLMCFDASSLNLLNSMQIANLSYQGRYSCNTISTKVAVKTADKIYVFPDKNLQNPLILPFTYPDADHFLLTDNDLLAVAYPGRYEMLRLSDQQVMASINITDYPVYSRGSCISTSRDGKYACIVTKNGVNLYEINAGSATVIYSDTRTYRSVLFNEDNPGQLFLTFYGSNTLEVRNASGFSLLRTINLPTQAEVIRNFDPENGYLLLTDYVHLYALNLTDSKIKFKTLSSDSRPYLFGKRLFSYSGFAWDISKYIQK
ncbi:MAG: hypothetical protein WCR72_03890 [Bacteroidota bacterium]